MDQNTFKTLNNIFKDKVCVILEQRSTNFYSVRSHITNIIAFLDHITIWEL